MYANVDELIEHRKEMWKASQDITQDKKFRDSVVDYMLKNNRKDLFKQMQKDKEKFIELFFVVVNKEMKTVPFFLNDVQLQLLNKIKKKKHLFSINKTNHIKFLVLKGRQQGMTTFIEAYNLAHCITEKNFSGYVLADNAENTTTIFQDKVHYPYDNVPKELKPSELYSNRKELLFDTKTGSHGLNSKIRVQTAGNQDAGRSKTINYLHISEGAFVDDLKGLLIGLEEALTKNVVALIESTANGFNYFKDLWDGDNNWENVFFEWWHTPEYSLNFTSRQEERKFMRKVKEAPDNTDKPADTEEWIYSKCKWLRDKIGLETEQIFWYYDKWRDKRESIKQEYPCTAEEAFLASGRPYFHTENVARRLAEVKLANNIVMQGYFEYEYAFDDYTGKKVIDDESIVFIEDPRGIVTIFEEPKESVGYSIGADTSSTGIDYNIGQVVDSKGRQKAVLKVANDEDLFADNLYCLGTLYNMAMIAPEVNHSTHPTKVLAERMYENLYLRENSPDATGTRHIQNYGFRTTQANRGHILGLFREISREHIDYVQDETTLKEMLSFIINDKGKPEAEEGKHDDTIMAYAIALHVTDQQTEEVKKPVGTLEGEYFESELKDMGYTDWEIQQYFNGEDLYI